MSTRCHVAVYENEEKAKKGQHHALLYKHSDGYPEGILPILEGICQKFQERRGMGDTEYLSAWVLWALVNDSVENMKKWHKEDGIGPEDGIECLGFGVCSVIHTDIAYFYKIYPGMIEVFSTSHLGGGLRPVKQISIS
jgi:hypothetical protein